MLYHTVVARPVGVSPVIGWRAVADKPVPVHHHTPRRLLFYVSLGVHGVQDFVVFTGTPLVKPVVRLFCEQVVLLRLVARRLRAFFLFFGFASFFGLGNGSLKVSIAYCLLTLMFCFLRHRDPLPNAIDFSGTKKGCLTFFLALIA